MKEIFLTKGMIALVDTDDYEWLAQWKWYARLDVKSGIWTAVRNGRNSSGQRIKILMHREIMGVYSGLEIDHIDRNELNNMRSNLRTCSRGQNMGNQRLRSDNKTGYKGVCKRYVCSWEAKIKVNKKRIELGTYPSPTLAALAYDAAAIKYFGEFALTNKMLGLL